MASILSSLRSLIPSSGFIVVGAAAVAVTGYTYYTVFAKPKQRVVVMQDHIQKYIRPRTTTDMRDVRTGVSMKNGAHKLGFTAANYNWIPSEVPRNV
jgi:hypothetical protein